MSTELFDLFLSLPQQGPGTDACTEHALELVPDRHSLKDILDIGCGTGRQTGCLLRSTTAQVTAVDIWDPFLEKLQARAQKEGTSKRLTTQCISMDKLGFAEASFDLIWAEGSVYLLGFDHALKQWPRFLRPKGCMALTEVTWLKEQRPQEVNDFWSREYPAMRTIQENLSQIELFSLRVIDHFVLPVEAWTEGLYDPLENEIERLRKQGGLSGTMAELLNQTEHEIEMFRRYPDTYGYVFYIMQKRET